MKSTLIRQCKTEQIEKTTKYRETYFIMRISGILLHASCVTAFYMFVFPEKTTRINRCKCIYSHTINIIPTLMDTLKITHERIYKAIEKLVRFENSKELLILNKQAAWSIGFSCSLSIAFVFLSVSFDTHTQPSPRYSLCFYRALLHFITRTSQKYVLFLISFSIL